MGRVLHKFRFTKIQVIITRYDFSEEEWSLRCEDCVRRVFDTTIEYQRAPSRWPPPSGMDIRNYISSSIVQPLISLLLQSTAFKPGFRAFKHLAASAISRGSLIQAYFFRGTGRLSLVRFLEERTRRWMLVCRGMLSTEIVTKSPLILIRVIIEEESRKWYASWIRAHKQLEQLYQ